MPVSTQFEAILDVADLDGTNGFVISGSGGELAGFRVGTGDINGDGYTDLIVGAPYANTKAGAAYVLLGSSNGFSDSIDLSAIAPGNGFKIAGLLSGDQAGYDAQIVRDINGDGIDDIVVSATHVGARGASYVVFGSTAGFGSSFDLSTLDGTNGFKLNGVGATDLFGIPATSAGDLNGDGIGDLVFGAAPNNHGHGATYVVFGSADGFSSTFDLTTLNGTNGFVLTGRDQFDYSGFSASSAGDVNGDGFDDLIVGSIAAFDAAGGPSYPGAAYVIYGTKNGFAATIAAGSLNGTVGSTIFGVTTKDLAGWSVSGAGDINGDGLADIVIGAQYADPHGASSGAAYVVFGKQGGFGNHLDLSTLDGSNGFKLSGEVASDMAGRSVSSAGDINGDGFADIIVGAIGNDPNAVSNAGAAYVVFGKKDGFDANIDLSTLNGSNGFKIDGAAASDGTGFSTKAAGDLNKDGFDDIIVTARGVNGGNGAAYVIYGHAPDIAVHRTGTATDNIIHGGAFDDVLRGGSGRDTLYGHDGNDKIDGGGASDTMIGGAGNDTYMVNNTADRVVENHGEGTDTLFTTLGTYALGSEVENLTFTGAGDFTGTGNELDNVITGGAGNDTLSAGFDGIDKLIGGDGDDLFNFEGTFTADDRVVGGDGNDTLQLWATSAKLAHVQDVEQITMTTDKGATPGIYALTATDKLVAHGAELTIDATQLASGQSLSFKGAAETDGSFHFIGSDGNDKFVGGGGDDTAMGGLGADMLTGGDGEDQFLYGGVTDSAALSGKAKTYDVVTGFNAADDMFLFNVKVGDVHFLRAASDSIAALENEIGEKDVDSFYAAVVTTPNHTFLVVDANGAAGYQAGADYLIELKGGDLTGFGMHNIGFLPPVPN